MWAKGTLEKVVITVDGNQRELLSYGEAWVQEGPEPLLNPVAAAIIWVLLQGVTSEKVPSSSDKILHRVLTTIQILFSYIDHMPEERMQEIVDRLLAESTETKGD